MTPSPAQAVDRVIRDRRTTKMTASADAPAAGGLPREAVDEILAVAGSAPFHHPAPADRRAEAAEPWRCHALDARACRGLRARALADGVGGKVPAMLGAASALALVTWLPEGPVEREPRLRFEGSLVNMEHVAAAGAMVQNVLLAATARDLRTYWSSGGWLSTPAGLGVVGARPDEVLVGAVFFFPASLAGATVKPGKHRDARSPLGAWARWAEVPAG